MKQRRSILRQSTCLRCIQGENAGTDWARAFCKKRRKVTNVYEACYCEEFLKRLDLSGDVYSDLGYKYRCRQNKDYRTKKQWEAAGYKIKEGMKGHKMHASSMSTKTYLYFLPEEVEPDA